MSNARCLLCCFPAAGSASCKPRPACTESDYFYTHTPCDSQGQVALHTPGRAVLCRRWGSAGRERWCRKTICCIYSCLNIDCGAGLRGWPGSCCVFVTRSRLGSCTSGSSPRSAARPSKGPRRCRRRGPSRTVRHATPDSLSPTRPPASPARRASTPTEQVQESDRT